MGCTKDFLLFLSQSLLKPSCFSQKRFTRFTTIVQTALTLPRLVFCCCMKPVCTARWINPPSESTHGYFAVATWKLKYLQPSFRTLHRVYGDFWHSITARLSYVWILDSLTGLRTTTVWNENENIHSLSHCNLHHQEDILFWNKRCLVEIKQLLGWYGDAVVKKWQRECSVLSSIILFFCFTLHHLSHSRHLEGRLPATKIYGTVHQFWSWGRSINIYIFAS